jgi:O-antigen ligase
MNLRVKPNKFKFTFYYLTFFIFYLLFFLYQNFKLEKSGLPLTLVINFLILVLFTISLFKPKTGFYIFIFLIPLLNFFPYIFHVAYFQVILVLFFPILLAYILNKAKDFLYPGNYLCFQVKYPAEDYKIAISIFIVLIVISIIITISRYVNFYPFITGKFYDLKININGVRSTDAINGILEYGLNALSGFAIFILASSIFKKIKELLYAVILLILSTLISSFFVIYQSFFDSGFGNVEPWISSGRFNATFADPNALGAFTVLMFPLLFLMIFYFKKWYLRLLFFVFFVFFIFLIIFSGSRITLIGIFVSIILILTMNISNFNKKINIRHGKRKLIAVVAIILIIILVISFFLVVVFSEKNFSQVLLKNPLMMRFKTSATTLIYYFKNAGFKEALKSISNYRYFFWERAYQMGRDYPVSGVGSGAYIYELPDYHFRYNKGFTQIDSSGNYYLQFFAELGITGLILILYIFYTVIKKSSIVLRNMPARKKEDKYHLIFQGLFISFISMVVVLIFGSHTNSIEVNLIFWLVIGLIFSYYKLFFKTYSPGIKTVESLKKAGKHLNSGCDQKPINTPNPRYTVSRTISYVLIVIIFTASFIFTSVGALSVNMKQNINKWNEIGKSNEFGFYKPEIIDGKKAMWTEKVASKGMNKKGNILGLNIKASNPDIDKNKVTVKIYIDNFLKKEVNLTNNNWQLLNIELPENGLNKFTITIVLSRVWSPADWGINNDSRDLGIIVSGL